MINIVAKVENFKSWMHYKVCPHCGSILEFSDTEINITSEGFTLYCPNCHHNVI